MNNEIEYKIKIDTYNMTINYALKLLERLTILLKNENQTTDMDKFILLKTAATDICFSCELLLKSRISTYNNGNGYDTWKTHNLLDIFNKLDVNDQQFLSNELDMSLSNIINILNDKSTSDAFIKRYLYEDDTGIPNYIFLSNFVNALIKLNNRDIVFDLNNIDVLKPQFNYQQFSFEELIQKHSSLIFRKSKIYDIADINDEFEKYIVKNMKSCDYALFSELRYKYFDKNQNPKREHEFSQLHKRLDEACKFLIAKSRYMDKYMSKESTMDFYWALESLMFYEKFDVGDSVKELYADLNETFEKSRYCTINYYDNYYNSHDFAITIKNITDLLMMDNNRANRIINNKNELLSLFGQEFMLQMAFTVNEVDKIDVDYVKKLSKVTNISLCPKTILLENNYNIREKIFYFINTYSYSKIPIEIDFVVENTAGGYLVNMEKYYADLDFENNFLNPNKDKIKKYIELSKIIHNKDIILYIVEKNIDIDLAINRYTIITEKCSKLAAKPNIINKFIKIFGTTFIDGYDLNRFNKYFLLFNYFESENCNLNHFWDIDSLEKLYDYSFEKIVDKFCLFKKYNFQNLFFSQLNKILDMNEIDLNNILLQLSNNRTVADNYSYDSMLFEIDINKFASFIKKINLIDYPDNRIDIEKYKSGEIEKIYELIRDKNLLFLYNEEGNINIIDNLELFKELLQKDLIKNINDPKYDDKDREGIAVYTKKLFLDKDFKKVLFDILDTELVINHPKVLHAFYSWYSTNEDIYRINIYNNWYNKILSNNICSNGSKINLDAEKIKYLEDLLIAEIVKSGDYRKPEELSVRLEALFTDNQLIQSMNNNIFSKYKLEFMKKIINLSKFKEKDFKDINFFGNLFEVIDTNMISEDKIVNLLNILYNYKNNAIVINFVKKICSCKKTTCLSSITFEDSNGIKIFDDQLLDYLILNLTSKDELSTIDFISNLKIEIYNPDIYWNEDLYNVESYDTTKKTGMDILLSIKYKLLKNSHMILNDVIDKISSSYLVRKIKIYVLNYRYRRINEGEDIKYDKKR